MIDPNDPFLGSLGYNLSCSAASVQSGDQIKFETYWTQLKAQNVPVGSTATFGNDESQLFPEQQKLRRSPLLRGRMLQLLDDGDAADRHDEWRAILRRARVSSVHVVYAVGDGSLPALRFPP